MSQRLATRIRETLPALLDQYDERLRAVPGYANLPESVRRDIGRSVLELIAVDLEADDNNRLIEFIHERAEQVLARGVRPESFLQTLMIPQDMIAQLVETVAESNHVWRSLGQAQMAAWEVVARERRHIEQILRENEEKFKAIYEGSNDAVMLLNEKGFFDCNPRTLEMFGFKTKEEFAAVHPADVSPQFQADGRESWPVAQAQIQIAYQQGFNRFEWIHRRSNGEDFPAEVLLSAFELGDQRVLQATVRDITERKRAEEAVRQGAEQHERAARYLRATVEATKELNQAPDLTTLCRRTVELAREKFDIERCGLYLLDETLKYMRGTFGTDDQGNTTDERGAHRSTDEFSYLLLVSEQQLWVVREAPHVYYDDAGEHRVGVGWTAGTVLRGAAGPLAVLFNDRAISGAAVDTTQQEALAVYCSAVGTILERKLLDEQARASFVRRDVQVRTSTEVAQEIASATAISDLLQRVVTLIKERFNYYHVQIFRYEPDQDAVVLLTGYGATGQHMLADGHRLRMGHGVVGTAAASGQSILAADVQQDADWRPNPHLPDTRGELAVPIKWREQVLGILDVQSDRINALTDDDRWLLEGLCGQIASAMESTRLLEQLRQNQVQLSEALKIARMANWEYDVATDTFTFNDQFYALLRTTAEREGGYTMRSMDYAQRFVHPEDAPTVGREVQLAIETTDPKFSREIDHRIFYGDGQPGYVTVRFSIQKDAQGRTVKTFGANQDITEQKLAELDLQKFKLGLDRSTAAIFITDPTGVITYANPAFATIYGYALEETVGQTPRIIKSGLIPQEQYQHFWGTLLAGETVAGEIVNKTKDGRLISIQGSNSAILDERGRIIGFLALHNDITGRKRIEDELARSAQLLNTIINTSRDLIYVKDTQSRFLAASQAVARLIGLASPQDLIGKNDYDFFPYELAHKYFTDEQTILESGEPLIDIEESAAYADGTPIWLLTTKIPFRAADGTVQGIVGIGRDITERKRAEQRMEETLRETERLYAAVSHEGWQTYRQTGTLPEGYVFDQALIKPADKVWEPEIALALKQQTQVASRSTQRAIAVSPLTARGETLGALGIYDDPAHPLSTDDLQLIEAVSEQVALALENARLFDQTQIALADTRALFRFSDLASRETEIKPIYDNVAQLLVEETGFAGAWIAQVDTQAQVLRGVAGAGAGMGADRNLDVVPYQHLQTPATIAAREGVMIVVNDPLHDERLSDLPDRMKAVVGKSIAMPVIIDGEIESIIAATRPVDGLDISERDQRLLQTAAAQIAIAVQRARLFERTQRDAEREYTINRVTSRIRNARSVDEVLSIAAQELRLATRTSRSVVEILPDTEHLIHSGNGEGGQA